MPIEINNCAVCTGALGCIADNHLPGCRSVVAELREMRTDLCPKCGGDIFSGYGMAGGGMGFYRGCDNCDWFEKTQDGE